VCCYPELEYFVSSLVEMPRVATGVAASWNILSKQQICARDDGE